MDDSATFLKMQQQTYILNKHRLVGNLLEQKKTYQAWLCHICRRQYRPPAQLCRGRGPTANHDCHRIKQLSVGGHPGISSPCGCHA